MRLYLSSFRIGDQPSELIRMAGELERLGRLGLRPDEVDLRDFFDGCGHLAGVIAPYDVLWLRGGNVFTLRHVMHASGLDDIVLDGLRRDAFVYAGYSAGPCVLAPSLRGLEACDSPDEVTALYGAQPMFDGLGVLDHAFVPHVQSPDHPESAALDGVVERYRAEGVPHVALRDGQVLVVDGGTVTLW